LDDVRIELLGRFRVAAGDREVAEGDWPARRAQELVALLALADGRRLVRDQVIELLWPHLGAEAGAANLRKAAHHARRTLGDPGAIVLRSGRVELFPARTVTTDVEGFLRDAERALLDPDTDSAVCARAAAGCAGELLPNAPYEEWTQEPRRQVHARLTELLRRSADWERLMEVEPTDEAACRELMRAAIDAGRRHVALRWYERLRIALVRELGAQPDDETRALYDRCTVGVRLGERVFVGREVELADAAGQLRSVARGGTAALLVRGPTGIGKSALCREVVHRADEGGWRVITVAATPSAAPYGPIGAAIEELLVGARASPDALPERTRSILAEPPLRGAPTRHQVVAVLRRALALAESASPTLLCVEDAHLLDEATADVLHQLVAGGGGDPLLVMLAYRAEWIRTSLPRGITELARNDRTLSLQLGPLDDGEIAELVALAAPGRPAPEAIARIVHAAQGSPFFALELTRAPGSGAADTLPQTVRQAIIERLVGLDATTMDALTMLAIAEDELDLASVLALTGLEEPDALRCSTPRWTPGFSSSPERTTGSATSSCAKRSSTGCPRIAGCSCTATPPDG
jgi:DNA-binding SARP family transcriptional activator